MDSNKYWPLKKFLHSKLPKIWLSSFSQIPFLPLTQFQTISTILKYSLSDIESNYNPKQGILCSLSTNSWKSLRSASQNFLGATHVRTEEKHGKTAKVGFKTKWEQF